MGLVQSNSEFYIMKPSKKQQEIVNYLLEKYGMLSLQAAAIGLIHTLSDENHIKTMQNCLLAFAATVMDNEGLKPKKKRRPSKR